MKKLKKIWFSIWENNENPKTDNVKAIMAILTCNNSIETQISMKLEIDALFDEKLILKRKQNKREIEAIDFFFSPTKAEKIEVVEPQIIK